MLLEFLFHLFECPFSFHVFQHSFGEMLIFSLKGWGSWDCSVLFPSFSLKSPFPVKMRWQILSHVPRFAKWYMLRVPLNAFISDCAGAFWYYLLMHIQLFEKLSVYRHIVAIWPRSNEVVVPSSVQSDGTLPAENLIFRFFTMLLCLWRKPGELASHRSCL